MCDHCGQPLEDDRVGGLHPACFAERVPGDALATVLGGAVHALGLLMLVWGA
jgi:hypothetical protein